MKIAATIAGILLGFIFIALPGALMLGLMHMPPPAAGTPQAQFMEIFYPTGWLTFVQVCEIVGGLLVAIPKTRNFGLLVLGPIIVNILCFHILVAKSGLVGPPLIVAVLAAFLLFAGRGKFAALSN
jgi:putative oxidoreductase